MLDSREAALAFPRGDLELGFCEDCGFIQNLLFDPSVQHYSTDYEETQVFSPRFQRFVDEICDDQHRKYDLAGKTALEIGCGKGEFLVALCERTGCAGIGIDPGYRPERTHSPAAARLTFIQDFYGPKYRALQADYVCCRHTLEHIHDVLDFMRLVRTAIGDRPDVPVYLRAARPRARARRAARSGTSTTSIAPTSPWARSPGCSAAPASRSPSCGRPMTASI